MKHLNLTFLFSAWLATVVIFGIGASSAVAQTEATCRSTYDLMLKNESTRADIAAALGQSFLSQGCGKLFPTVVEPIKNFIATAERQAAPAAAPRPVNAPATAGQTGGGTVATQDKKSISARYGSRDPRTCEDTKAPAKGAITAALALKYLNCQMEYVSGNGNLYLVENVKVEVGGGIPYAAIIGHRSLSEIDVNHPVYPIRGSLLSYSCRNQLTEYAGPPNTNCATYNNPKATGYCYKTTFGDWRCYMSDPAANNDANIRHGVAPPK